MRLNSTTDDGEAEGDSKFGSIVPERVPQGRGTWGGTRHSCSPRRHLEGGRQTWMQLMRTKQKGA